MDADRLFTRLAILDLDVRERLGERRRLPVAAQRLRLLGVAVDLGLVEVVNAAVVVEPEVARADEFVAARDDPEQVRRELRGERVALLVRQIHARAEPDVDQRADLATPRVQVVLERRRLELREVARLARALDG